MTEAVSQPGAGEPADAELVLRAPTDRIAFASLYARYFDRIYRYCYRRMGSPEEAADATSQVFAKAITGIASCQPDSFRSWLFAIAHNVTIDWSRAIRPHEPLETVYELAAPDPSPEDHAIAGEGNVNVARILSHLNTTQRQILELRLAGLTSKEIAVVMEMTPNAVDQAQFRAVSRLRTILGVTVAAKRKRP